jgi:hypothetical protein
MALACGIHAALRLRVAHSSMLPWPDSRTVCVMQLAVHRPKCPAGVVRRPSGTPWPCDVCCMTVRPWRVACTQPRDCVLRSLCRHGPTPGRCVMRLWCPPQLVQLV